MENKEAKNNLDDGKSKILTFWTKYRPNFYLLLI